MKPALPLALLALALPLQAHAWGPLGHQTVVAIAQAYMTPKARAAAEALLASDTDTITGPDMLSRSVWADADLKAHPERFKWHFANIEIDKPDLKAACFGFPAPGRPASSGPADDCVVDKIAPFERELRDTTQSPDERRMALKFLLHFVGDMHQPLHSADNNDRGGNCTPVALDGATTVNLHSYWDEVVLNNMASDPTVLADRLVAAITPELRAEWAKGDAAAWAMETWAVGKASAYTFGTASGCDPAKPRAYVPYGYEQAARPVIELQLERAGVRLATVLNRALG